MDLLQISHPSQGPLFIPRRKQVTNLQQQQNLPKDEVNYRLRAVRQLPAAGQHEGSRSARASVYCVARTVTNGC